MKYKYSNLQIAKNISGALGVLKDREQEILVLRYGLQNEPFWTLEKIGKKYKITRERSRQIINHSKKKLSKFKNPKLEVLFKSIERIIENNGGIISEKMLVSLFGPENEPNILGSVNLILEACPQCIRLKVDHLDVFWAISKISAENVDQIAHKAHDVLENNRKPVQLEDLLNKLKKEYPKYNGAFLKSIILGSYNLMTVRDNKIGLISWPEINPKNTKNKIYYVLDHANKPLHFREIQERIENYDFNGKVPSVATVHNELIADNRFVLIGKGIYALKKWGYNKGTVADVIIKILKEKKTMPQEKIIDSVLKQRRVAKNTIIMNLISKPYFARISDGVWKYQR